MSNTVHALVVVGSGVGVNIPSIGYGQLLDGYDQCPTEAQREA